MTCYEPLFVFWYDFAEGAPRRHLLAFNHLSNLADDLTKRNPPPNFVPAVGMKVHIKDMDADGANDAVICGKGGLYVFYRRGQTPEGKPAHRLPPEDTYPSWEKWTTMPVPGPAPLPRKIHGPGTAPKKPAARPGKGNAAGWIRTNMPRLNRPLGYQVPYAGLF